MLVRVFLLVLKNGFRFKHLASGFYTPALFTNVEIH